MPFGVIFDMDGVLVLTEDAHWASWRCVAADRGVEVTHDAFQSCFGQTNQDCVPAMFGPGIDPDELARIADAKEAAFREIIGTNVPLSPGLLPLLERLRDAGALLAVGSSAPRENIDLILDAGGLRKFFSAAVDGSQVARGKPAPDVFLQAADALDLPATRCVVIEDAPAGIRAARAAGASAVGVATTNDAEALRDAGAHLVAPNVAALDVDALLVLVEVLKQHPLLRAARGH